MLPEEDTLSLESPGNELETCAYKLYPLLLSCGLISLNNSNIWLIHIPSSFAWNLYCYSWWRKLHCTGLLYGVAACNKSTLFVYLWLPLLHHKLNKIREQNIPSFAPAKDDVLRKTVCVLTLFLFGPYIPISTELGWHGNGWQLSIFNHISLEEKQMVFLVHSRCF